MDLIRSIINFFGFNDAIVDGIGERGDERQLYHKI